MENLVTYLYRHCNKQDVVNYLNRYINVVQEKVPEVAKLCNHSEDKMIYVVEELKYLIRDISDSIFSTGIDIGAKLQDLEHYCFLYNNRLDGEVFNPILNLIDKYRAEKGIDWRGINSTIELQIGGELLGFEVNIHRANPSHSVSPTVIHMKKEVGCLKGYEIVVYTDYSYDDLKVAKNFAKVRSEILKEYKEYQKAVKGCSILDS